MSEWREQRFDPQWTPTGTQRRMATAAGVALVAALVLGRAQVVLLAAPLLVGVAASTAVRSVPALAVCTDPRPGR